MELTHPSDLRNEILRVSTRLFAERGLAGTSLRVIAEASGCSKPAVYYHFAGKEELYRSTVALYVDGLIGCVARIADSQGPVRDRLELALQTLSGHARENVVGMRLLERAELEMGSNGLGPLVANARKRQLELLERIIQQGIEDGELRADVPPHECAVALAGALNLQFRLWLRDGDDWSTGRLCRTISLFFDGLALGGKREGPGSPVEGIHQMNPLK